MIEAPERVQRLTPAQAAVQRANARAMLAQERALLAGARRDVQDAVDEAIAGVARQTDTTSDAAKAAILALLLLSGERLRARLRTRIRTGRREARVTAIERLGAELASAGGSLGAAATVSRLLSPKLHADPAHAASAADTLAAAWQSAAVFRVTESLAAGRNVARALDETTKLADGRLRRVAATEVPRAYNDEHRRAAADVGAALADDVGLDVLLVRRWDAILDMRTCPTCRAHDGEVTMLGRPFKSGDEPAFVHPWCRCMSTVIAIPRMRP